MKVLAGPRPAVLDALLVLFLSIIFVLTPGASFAQSRNFTASEGSVSSLLIFERAGFARSYGLFTSGVARLSYDDVSKTIQNLKCALLMETLVTNNPSLKKDLLSRKAYKPERANELAFVQNEAARFDNGQAKIKGQLFLNGASREVVFSATLNKMGALQDPAQSVFESNARAIGFSLHTNIKRSDFNLGDDSASAPINDDVVLMLDIVAGD